MLTVAALARAEISIVDDANNRITLEEPARRIVAVSPHLAELVYAAGAGERLIATVRGADYPPDVLTLPVVGDAAGLDFERIRQLEPDLILAWGSGNKVADINYLTAAGVPVFIMEPRTVSDIPRHLRLVAKLAGTADAADEAATRFERDLQQLQTRYSGASVVSVIVEIWHQPVFTVGATHPVSNALQICGARNALDDYPLLAGPVPLENVFMADADVIVSLTGMKEPDARAQWNRHLPTTTGRPLRVISLEPDLLTRPGPRMLAGVELLCQRIAQSREQLRGDNRTTR